MAGYNEQFFLNQVTHVVSLMLNFFIPERFSNTFIMDFQKVDKKLDRWSIFLQRNYS